MGGGIHILFKVAYRFVWFMTIIAVVHYAEFFKSIHSDIYALVLVIVIVVECGVFCRWTGNFCPFCRSICPMWRSSIIEDRHIGLLLDLFDRKCRSTKPQKICRHINWNLKLHKFYHINVNRDNVIQNVKSFKILQCK